MTDNQIVRWYVLTLPVQHRGNPAKGLQTELDYRIRNGEPSFDFFAPTYIENVRINGKDAQAKRPLLFNYVFVKASETEIFRIKQRFPLYNFLPKIRKETIEYFPYISEKAMKNLRWVAKAYSNMLPAYTPDPRKLVKGDKIRITGGQFEGVEATIVRQSRAGEKEIVVCINNWMWIPLLHVGQGNYEVISLNKEGKNIYNHLDNDRIQEGLHQALRRHYSHTEVNDADKALAKETLNKFGNIEMDSDVMRCKLYSILLLAYTILNDTSEKEKLSETIICLLPLIKAEQSKALLLTTLYGCSDNCLYREQAYAIANTWASEKAPKKSKRIIMERLKDYDNWLGHEENCKTTRGH